MKSTIPAPGNFEAHCSAIGIDLQSARQATLTKSIRDMLKRQDETLNSALEHLSKVSKKDAK